MKKISRLRRRVLVAEKSIEEIQQLVSTKEQLSYEELVELRKEMVQMMKDEYRDQERKNALQMAAKEFYQEIKNRDQFGDDPNFEKQRYQEQNPNSGLSDGKKPLTKKEKEHIRGVRSHNVDWSPCGYEPENAARLCGVYIIQAPTGKTYVGMSDKNCLNESLLRTIDAISRGEIQNKQLTEDWKRYGESAFKIQVLQVFDQPGQAKSVKESVKQDILSQGYELYNLR